LPKGENCEFAVFHGGKKMLNAIRRAVLTQAKSANSQISLASEIEATRRARIAQSDYLFLRVTPAGYDWGKESDQDGLLPNVFYKRGL